MRQQHQIKKLYKQITDIETTMKTLPGLKAQLQELKKGSSSSSSSLGESQTRDELWEFGKEGN